ncbi:hypothetical protein HMSSN036_65150 [Paenibacillus macerans]|nr:hypothetical protein HMSSN036_65150 [Paenibacillus macerans]
MHRADLALFWQGIAFAGAEHDVQLAAYLLDPTENDQTISGLAAKYGLPHMPADEDVYGKGAKFKVPDPETLGRHLARKGTPCCASFRSSAPIWRNTRCTGCSTTWRCRCRGFSPIWRSRA